MALYQRNAPVPLPGAQDFSEGLAGLGNELYQSAPVSPAIQKLYERLIAGEDPVDLAVEHHAANGTLPPDMAHLGRPEGPPAPQGLANAPQGQFMGGSRMDAQPSAPVVSQQAPRGLGPLTNLDVQQIQPMLPYLQPKRLSYQEQYALQQLKNEGAKESRQIGADASVEAARIRSAATKYAADARKMSAQLRADKPDNTTYKEISKRRNNIASNISRLEGTLPFLADKAGLLKDLEKMRADLADVDASLAEYEKGGSSKKVTADDVKAKFGVK